MIAVSIIYILELPRRPPKGLANGLDYLVAVVDSSNRMEVNDSFC
jgi:hypothetical protein